METFLSAVLGELISRSINFISNKWSKPLTLNMEEKPTKGSSPSKDHQRGGHGTKISTKCFTPINLCNVIYIYKVISKCLVNRLRPFWNMSSHHESVDKLGGEIPNF